MNIFLPQELKDIPGFEDDLHFFIDLMVRKLHLNRHKGFVKGKTLQDLWDKHKDESQELYKALCDESQFNVALECSDSANFSFLIGLACLQMTKVEFEMEQKGIK